MPFVFVQLPKFLGVSAGGTKNIEMACQNAWISMTDSDNTFFREDIGGVVVTCVEFQNRIEPPRVQINFLYVDRGDAFNVLLLEALEREFQKLFRGWPSDVPKPFRVVAIPTKPEGWFSDPNWARSQQQE